MSGETTAPADVARVQALVAAIKPILAGEAPEVQGAVLADLLSTWIAGHVIEGDPAATRRMHNTLIGFHIESVREMIPGSAEEIMRTRGTRPSGGRQ